MISAKFYAALKNNHFTFEHTNTDIFGNEEFYKNENKIKEAEPIMNYANFFGNGIDLYDNSLVFGDKTDYYGLVGEPIEIIVYLLDSTLADLKNGITFVFDKFSCSSIALYEAYLDDESNLMRGTSILSLESENSFPLQTHIELDVAPEFETCNMFYIHLLNIHSENHYITLQGLIMGKLLNMEEFFSFDSIAESRPLGEDLPLNEISSKVFLPDNFESEENQSVIFYDNGIFEKGLLLSAKKERAGIYTIKSRNMLNLCNEDDSTYNFIFSETVTDWNKKTLTAEEAIINLNANNEFVFSYPEWFSTLKLSPFLPPCSGRKILQQIAWATCCGIDTNYRDEIAFVPLLADDSDEDVLLITNNDDRILESSVTEGEKYSKIVWEYKKYKKGAKIEELGEIDVEKLNYGEEDVGQYGGSISLSEPFILTDFNGEQYGDFYGGPFSLFVEFPYLNTYTVRGYKYTSYTAKKEILTGISKGKTLTISDQDIYPIDMTKKIAQLRKWYAHNNTLNATVVDNNDIRLGRIISLQLEDGTYFTGVITKIERSNISDYHTVRLEAHEWH